MQRTIIEIDESRCTGCGQCVLDCAEGAIAIVNGKAKVVSDSLCDGLGACLAGCPHDALRLIQREADPFDEQAVEARKTAQQSLAAQAFAEPLPCGCAGTHVKQFAPRPTAHASFNSKPALFNGHWPVKIRLVPPSAPFLRGADILIAADCAAVASPAFHQITEGKVVLIGCPKFEDTEAMTERLAEMLHLAAPKSLTVLRMEVPCCKGLGMVCRNAAKQHNLEVQELILGCDGNLLNQA